MSSALPVLAGGTLGLGMRAIERVGRNGVSPAWPVLHRMMNFARDCALQQAMPEPRGACCCRPLGTAAFALHPAAVLWLACHSNSGAATWVPGGSIASAVSTNSASLAGRTGCSAAGIMNLRMDSIHAAVRSKKFSLRTACTLRAERTSSTRSKPIAATACSSRSARPRLSASGSRPGACGTTTTRVCTPQRLSQRASSGICAGAGVQSVRSRP
jgi:hypothetical protein